MAVSMCCVSISANAYTSNNPWKVTKVVNYPFIFPEHYQITNQNLDEYVELKSHTSGPDSPLDTFLNCTEVYQFNDTTYRWVVSPTYGFRIDAPSNSEDVTLYFIDKTQIPYFNIYENRWYNTELIEKYKTGSEPVSDLNEWTTKIKETYVSMGHQTAGIIIPEIFLKKASVAFDLDATNGLELPFNINSWNTYNIVNYYPVTNWFTDVDINNLVLFVGPSPNNSEDLSGEYTYSVNVKVSLLIPKSEVSTELKVGDYFPYVRPIDVSIVAPPIDATKQQELNDWVTNSGNMSQWDTDLGFELVPFVTSMLQPWMIKLMLVIFGFGVLLIFIRRSLHD